MKKLLFSRDYRPKNSFIKNITEILKKSTWLFLCFLNFSAFAFSQKVTLNEKNKPIGQILDIITSQTGIDFFYNNDDFDASHKISYTATNEDLNKVLSSLIGYQFSYQLMDNDLILISKKTKKQLQQERFDIRGTVTDKNKQPLAGVSLWVKGTRRGAVSGDFGNFTLSAKLNDTIVFQYLGFKSKELVIDKRRKEWNVIMEQDFNSLDEVSIVSTGYQKISKERATGSFATVTSEELEKVPTNNLINKLEGRVPGLQIDIQESDNTFLYNNISTSEGEASYKFRIRGQSTYKAEDMPLIVIDGTPTELDIRTLNPSDIAQITFLKDAAAASIYGARAANGVIVIETKKGTTGKTSISYSQDYSFYSSPSLSSLNLINSSDLLDLEKELIDQGMVTDPANASLFYSYPLSEGMEIYFQAKRGEITAAEEESALQNLRNRNNYNQVERYLLQPAESYTHNLSISGGQRDYTFFMSASYSHEKSQTKGEEGSRLTLTANQDFKLFDRLNVSTSLKGSFFDYKNNGNGLGLSVLSPSRTTFLPYEQIVDEDGSRVYDYRAFYKDDIENFESAGYLPWSYNYLDELENSDKTSKEQNYSANIELQLPIIKNLEAVGTFSTQRRYLNSRNFNSLDTYSTRNQINNATYLNPDTGELERAIPEGGILQNYKITASNYTARGQLNYNANYGKHAINAIGGIELRQTREQHQSSKLFGYDENAQTSVDLPSTQYTSVNGYTGTLSYDNLNTDRRRRFLSYYGNASYAFDTRYTVSGSIRLDDYNNFGVDKKYRRTPLWSIGSKWNIKREKFMAENTFFNTLALRASYGFNGNISLNTFPFTNLSLSGSDRFSYRPNASIRAAANPALRWEKTGIFNIGLDFGILNSRLNGTVEFYHKNSKDLIQDFPVSAFYGLPNNILTRNTSTLESKGVDVQLNGHVLDLDDFQINSNFVLSYNTNEVTDSRYDNYATYLNGTGATPPIKGYPINSIFAFRNAGLNESGATLVYDRNGEIVGPYERLTEIEDMKFMGSSVPQYYGSFSTTFSYKDLSLFVLAAYKMDYNIVNPVFGQYIRSFSFNQYTLSQSVVNRWRNPGDEEFTNVPGVNGLAGYSYSRYRLSEENIIDGDHIRLREISLTYNLQNILENTFINNASLSLSARNLGIIWRKNDKDIDPDFPPYLVGNLNLPPQGMYTVSLNVNF